MAAGNKSTLGKTHNQVMAAATRQVLTNNQVMAVESS